MVTALAQVRSQTTLLSKHRPPQVGLSDEGSLGTQATAGTLPVLVLVFAFGLGEPKLSLPLLLLALSLVLVGYRNEVRSRWHGEALLVAVFSITYAMSIVALGVGTVSLAVTYLVFPVAYVAGAIFTSQKRGQYRFGLISLAVIAGISVHGIANAVMGLSKYGLSPETRVLPDAWSGTSLTATIQGMLFVPLVGVVVFAALEVRRRWVLAIATLTGLIIGVIYNLASASRAYLLVLAIVVPTTVAYAGFLSGYRKRITYMLLLATVTGLLYWCYVADVFGLGSGVRSLPLAQRLELADTSDLFHDPRYARWKYVFCHFFENTDGGGYFRDRIGYAHNMWLDAYDVAGIVPFVLLVAVGISFLLGLKVFLGTQSLSVGTKVLALGIWLAFYLQLSTEPVLEAMPMYFGFLCIIAGAARGSVEVASCFGDAPRKGRRRDAEDRGVTRRRVEAGRLRPTRRGGPRRPVGRSSMACR